ncbi:hypothetical protein BDZ91DRAFT_822522 [Kalaharituber pfeilii]|nr:hypothetical protein BDZ91DRAFT_822522 [Kalaharituber pfeilii]
MHQLFANLPMDITVYALRYLTPWDFVLLRCVNKAHRDIFSSESICRIALRELFDCPWPHTMNNDGNARVMFDAVCRRRDNLRRGHFTSFREIRQTVASLVGTDSCGNHVLIARADGDQTVIGSLQVHWLEGDDVQLNTILRVFVNIDAGEVCALREQAVTPNLSASGASYSNCNKTGEKIGIPACMLEPLSAEDGKIVVSGIMWHAFRNDLPNPARIFIVLDIDDLVANGSSALFASLPSPIPTQHLWIPEMVFRNSTNLVSPSIQNPYRTPEFSEYSYNTGDPTVVVNRHYVLYMGCFSDLRSRLAADSFRPTSGDPKLWNPVAQRAILGIWHQMRPPRWEGVVGADAEGRLCFALARENGPGDRYRELSTETEEFERRYINVYKVAPNQSKNIEGDHSSLTKIAQIPLYGIPEMNYRLLTNIQTGKTAEYRYVTFSTTHILGRADPERRYTIYWRDAIITSSYTFPSTEDEMHKFLLRSQDPGDSWVELSDGTRWLRADGDGYVATPQVMQHRPTVLVTRNQETAQAMLPAHELASWFPAPLLMQQYLQRSSIAGKAYACPVVIKIPVGNFTGQGHTVPRTAVPIWPGNTNNMDKGCRPSLGTYSPCCTRLLGLGDGWLVYKIDCETFKYVWASEEVGKMVIVSIILGKRASSDPFGLMEWVEQ